MNDLSVKSKLKTNAERKIKNNALQNKNKRVEAVK